jgi:clan AA aspartic protease
MGQKQFPPGLDEDRVKRVLVHYEQQTDEKAIADDEATLEESGPGGNRMGLIHVVVGLRSFGSANGTYEADFLVDTGATDSLAPAAELNKIGVQPVGRTAYELANGVVEEYAFGLVEITFMGEVTAGRVIFGPDNAEPILGVTALESVGIIIDPANRTLKRLPAIPLK